MTPERWRQIEQLYHTAWEHGPAERSRLLDKLCAGDDTMRREVESLLDFDEGAEQFIEALPGELVAEMLGREPKCAPMEATPQAWECLKRLFESALWESPEKRVEFQAKSSGSNQALCVEAERLPAEGEDPRGFNENPGDISQEPGRASDLVQVSRGTAVESGPDPIPSAIGTYRILRLVGEGGMGTVYEAEQQAPHRIVAVKIIKPGLATHDLLRRFEREEYALGRLQHPGIAQIYEAGTADAGYGPQPYFAMEFIRGRSLLEYAEAQHLNSQGRLELMAKVCEAAHHAHQRGLIHCDLKPGNILVDETGQPKILDFGVARVTDSEAQAMCQTSSGQLVGTLAYMSPEQLVGDPRELDASSDVYALGVVLYELLAGRLPYELSRRLPEALQTIREQDPAALSSIRPNYRGDIETIVAKALEKNKARRYASAAGLAADIRHYLADEPITARPPTASYQLRKFARRHKALVLGAAVVIVVLLGGIIASTREAMRASLAEQAALAERDQAKAAKLAATQDRDRALRAERVATTERNRALGEEQRADTEAAVAKAINEFLQDDLLAQAGASAQAGPRTKPDPDLKVRTALDRAAARIAGKFDGRPLVEAAIRQTIGDTYGELGLYPEAERHIERAFELRRRVRGVEHPDTLLSMNSLGEQYAFQGKHERAEKLFRKVLEARRRVLGEEHLETLKTMSNLVQLYTTQGKYGQAEGLCKRLLELERRTLGEEHPLTLISTNNLGSLYRVQGKYRQAEPFYAKSLDIQRRVLGEEHPDTLTGMNNLALLYQQEGENGQAEAILTHGVEVERRVLGEEHPKTLVSMSNLANLYRAQGKHVQTEALYNHLLDVRRRVLGGEHPDTLKSLNNLAVLYWDEGKYGQAEDFLTQVVDGWRHVVGEKHPNTLLSKFNLAVVYRDEGKYAQAEPLLTEVLEDRRRLLGVEHPESLKSMHSLAALYRDEGKYAEAEPLLTKALEARRRVLGDEHPDTLTSLSDLALLYEKQGKYTEAESLLLKVLEVRQRVLGSKHPDTATALTLLSQIRLQQKKYAEAEPPIREALNRYQERIPDSWRVYHSQSLLGASLAGQGKYAEAEPSLLAGYQGMLQRQATIPADHRSDLQRAAEWIVQLYQDWGKPDKAAEWRGEESLGRK